MAKKHKNQEKWTLEDEIRLKELKHLLLNSSDNLVLLNREYSILVRKRTNSRILE